MQLSTGFNRRGYNRVPNLIVRRILLLANEPSVWAQVRANPSSPNRTRTPIALAQPQKWPKKNRLLQQRLYLAKQIGQLAPPRDLKPQHPFLLHTNIS